MKVSIYDIAREANVSSATVSRVLNRKPVVSKKTRMRVEEIMRKLNYNPSPSYARSAISAISSPSVGVIVVDIRFPHYAGTALAIERELFKLGYGMILCNTGESMEGTAAYLRMLSDKCVAGVMCIGSFFGSIFFEAGFLSKYSHLPFFFSNSVPSSAENAYSVIIAERHAIELCVNHLMEKGHRDIVYVRDTNFTSGSNKAESFRTVMSEKGLRGDEGCLFSTKRGLEGGTEAIDRIISSGRRFTAVIFGDDFTAAGGIQRLSELGYHVPGDIAVIGYNNTEAGIINRPKITTIDNKIDIMGNLCVKLFETVMDGQQSTRQLIVTPELIIRDST